MNKKNDLKWIKIALSTIIVVGLLSLFTYVSAPVTEHFEWSSINPATAVAGLVFTLCWLGVPLLLSIAILLFLCILLGLVFYKLLRIKKNK